MYLRTGLLAAGLGLAATIAAVPAGAQTPKRGGTLDLHDPGRRAAELRRPSRDDLRHGACRGAVLQRADPRPAGQSGVDHRVRLRSLHRDAEADRRRQDLHLQDPLRREVPRRQPSSRRRTSAPSWQRIVFPPKGITSARVSYYAMVDKIEVPDDNTIVFKLKFATTAFLPALADPFTWIYKKEILEKDPHWYEKNIMGSGPFKFASYEVGQAIKGVRNPDYYHKGQPYLDARRGHLRRQAVGARRRHPRRPRRHGVPRPAAVGARLAGQGGRQGRRRPGERLELRQHHHAQPQEEAVRRRPRAPRAGARRRPVGRRAGAFQDRQRQDGGRHRLPGLAAGGDQGGAAEDGRLLARHREVAGRGAPAAEGGGRRGAEVRADRTATSTSPTSSSAPG